MMMTSTQLAIKGLAYKVATMLEKGDTSAWTRPWKSSGAIPTNAMTNNPYHGMNRMALWVEAMIKNYHTHYWMTFKQKNLLAEKLECEISVIKGEQSTPCFRWVTWVPKQYRKISDDLYEDRKTKQRYQEYQVTQVSLKIFRVFNIDQMEGIPDGYYQDAEPIMPCHEQASAIREVVDGTGAEIRSGGDRAFYMPKHDFIGMPPLPSFFTEDDYYGTLFHELCHWSGHKDRLNRLELYDRSDESYAKEELVAEFGAAFLCAEFDVHEPSARHADYLAHWASQIREDPDMLMTAMRKAEKAATYIQSLKEKNNEQEMPNARVSG